MVATTNTRVALVEPDQTVASHFQSCLAAQIDITLVGLANTFAHFQQNVNTWLPDIVLMNLAYMAQVAPLRMSQMRPRCIALLPPLLPVPQVITALQDGAHGYLHTNDQCDAICQRVREIAQKQTFLEAPVIQALAQYVQHKPIAVNTIEKDILDALAQYGTIPQTAQQSTFDQDTLRKGLFSIILRVHSIP